MTERERLIKLIDTPNKADKIRNGGKITSEYPSEILADWLIQNGVIVPPCKTVWYIINRYTEFEGVMSASIEDLPLRIVKNLDKHEYYECKEEAEKALKEREHYE